MTTLEPMTDKQQRQIDKTLATQARRKEGLEIALIIAVAYVVQVQSAAWYLKLVDRIFDKAADDPASTDSRLSLA